MYLDQAPTSSPNGKATRLSGRRFTIVTTMAQLDEPICFAFASIGTPSLVLRSAALTLTPLNIAPDNGTLP